MSEVWNGCSSLSCIVVPCAADIGERLPTACTAPARERQAIAAHRAVDTFIRNRAHTKKGKLDGCIVWNAHNTIFGSKPSAYGGTQRPPKSRNTNRFLRNKRHFVEPHPKIPEYNGVPKVKL